MRHNCAVDKFEIAQNNIPFPTCALVEAGTEARYAFGPHVVGYDIYDESKHALALTVNEVGEPCLVGGRIHPLTPAGLAIARVAGFRGAPKDQFIIDRDLLMDPYPVPFLPPSDGAFFLWRTPWPDWVFTRVRCVMTGEPQTIRVAPRAMIERDLAHTNRWFDSFHLAAVDVVRLYTDDYHGYRLRANCWDRMKGTEVCF